MDEDGVDALADRLGVGARHLRRLFDQHVGASPVQVAQTHRLLFAKSLINETSLSMTDVALASGFGSVRRFNAAMQATYKRPPTELRRSSKAASAETAGVTLKLPFIPPYDWAAMTQFLTPRAIPGIEVVEPGCYRRSFRLDKAEGVVEVRPVAGANHLLATIRTSDISALATIVARLRRLFDLDADIAAIDAHLAADPLLAWRVAERPGLRVPGAWDGFELAVRAVLGQQVSVRAATTFAGRLAAGGPDRVFPTPEVVAEADLMAIGLTRARATTLNALGRAMAADRNLLRAYETLEETTDKLTALPGIGPWTAQYVAMRALREPDAFPASDLGLMRAMEVAGVRPTPTQLAATAEAWRPWRAYAALRLWMQPVPAEAATLAIAS
jgi:AraC family transcriptional regulator of adaptative response / DNA-3-methyladenine glycosylase II